MPEDEEIDSIRPVGGQRIEKADIARSAPICSAVRVRHSRPAGASRQSPTRAGPSADIAPALSRRTRSSRDAAWDRHMAVIPSFETPIHPTPARRCARALSMSQSIHPPVAIDYPESDGKPLAENDAQLHAIHYAFGALRLYYAARADVYVSADLLIYYEEGNPRVSVAPDTSVVFGVEDRMRRNYKVWEEGEGPDFVLEVASLNTWREDVERKPAIYAGLGVKEYFLYDPRGGVSDAAVAGLPAGGWGVRTAGGGGVDRPGADAAKPGAGAGAAGERRGDAFPRPGDGADASQPCGGARRTHGRSCRSPGGSVRTAGCRASGRARSRRPPRGSRRPSGRRGACRGAGGAPAGRSLTSCERRSRSFSRWQWCWRSPRRSREQRNFRRPSGSRSSWGCRRRPSRSMSRT